MRLADLAELVPTELNIDLDEHFAAYGPRDTVEDWSGFIEFLHDRKLIDGALYAKLCAKLPLEITVQNPDDARRMSLTMSERPTAIGADEPEVRLLEAPSAPSAALGEDAAEPLAAPQHPPRYILLSELDRGEVGEAHAARDVYLRRRVAFKPLALDAQRDPARFARFLMEMQIASQLDHPSIVPVYGLEVAPDGAIACATKLVEGRDLAQLLAEARQLQVDAKIVDDEHQLDGRLECFLKICDAVALAHDRGIVHRDLKPSHIMIGSHHEVYVMDWGIARPIGGAEPEAEPNVERYEPSADGADVARVSVEGTLGTIRYMSPEQAAGRNDELDGRSDQYTLGLILQEVVTLERAVPGTTSRQVLDNARRAVRSPLRPNLGGGVVPRELAAIITKATQPRPVRRYSSVTELAADVRRYLRGCEVEAQPDGSLQRAARWISKHPMTGLTLVAMACVLGLASTVTAAMLWQERAKDGAAPSPTMASTTSRHTTSARSPNAAASTQAASASTSVPAVTLEVVPPFASVTVDGRPQSVTDGRVTLTGEVGSEHRVVVTVAGEESTYSVVITERGPRPWQVRAVQLRPGAQPLGTPGNDDGSTPAPRPTDPNWDPYGSPPPRPAKPAGDPYD